VNILLFGDWWQIKPVSGTALYADPDTAPSAVAHHGMQLFWGSQPNAVHRCWELCEPMRCEDTWYNKFLSQCRDGELTEPMHQFFHGFPTACPTSIADDHPLLRAGLHCGPDLFCSCERLVCKDSSPRNDRDSSVPAGYHAPWVRDFLQKGLSGRELMVRECDNCRRKRASRRRVMRETDVHDPALQSKPFDVAPALYAFNVPRYFTTLLRARQFARTNNLTLSWCYARDIPLHREDRDLLPEQLDEKRCKWLEQHDQNTGHIASQTPLAQNLPIRLTDAVDRDLSLWRGRRGNIVGWVPHPEEERVEVDGELLLSKLPLVIYVHFPGATWRVSDDLPEGVYPLQPKSRTWTVNKNTKIKVRRTGFFFVPDFASTAHMIQGQNLDALFANIMEDCFVAKVSDELQVISYVMLSRAKYLQNVWIMGAFPRQLFARGPPPGPHILMRKLRGQVSPEEVSTEFTHASTRLGRSGFLVWLRREGPALAFQIIYVVRSFVH
jgi:hypothetical protein